SERHRPESHAHQTVDLEPQRLAQSPDLARPSLRNRDLELPSSLPERTDFYRARQHASVLQFHARPRLASSTRRIATNDGDIHALDLSAGMREPMRRVTVGGQQQHSLREVVESPDVR